MKQKIAASELEHRHFVAFLVTFVLCVVIHCNEEDVKLSSIFTLSLSYLSLVMKSPLRLLLNSIVLIAFVSAVTMSSEARVWTSTDGKKLEAIFESYDGETIQLKRRDGKSFKFPVDKLVKEDKEAAERFLLVGDDAMTVASAKKIDYLLARNLGKAGIKSFNERLPDDLFVRRVYLDIVGRIPTRREFLDFAESARDDKRAMLIDQLLASSGRSSHLFNYFADMHRLKEAGVDRSVNYAPYVQWWRDSLENNVPYKEMVTDMITATGNLGHNPAIGFLERDEGMEFDAFSNFGQVMMGIDVSCAQCHDHPFEEWTMHDFYQMAAFFGQTQRSVGRYSGADSMKAVSVAMPGAPDGWKKKFTAFATKNGVDMKDRNDRRVFGYYMSALGLNVIDNEAIEIRIPSTIDVVGGEVLPPMTMYGENASMGGKSRREGLAEWLTEPTNERFALNIANRMWERAFGQALVQPVTDFPMNWEIHTGQPEVLKFLGSEMVRVNFDLREFMRILYNTQSYQGYSTHDVAVDSLDHYYFQGPVLRRVRAEQAWDSLLTLAYGSDIDNVYGADGSFMKEVLNVNFEEDDNSRIFEKFEAYRKSYRKLGTKVLASSESLEASEPSIPVVAGIKMLRASRIEQPASAGSLLGSFGQSDRLVTDNHIFDGTVPQVLALMNGPVTDRLTGGESKVVEDLREMDAPDDKVRAVFFTMLSRYPIKSELDKGVDILEEYGDDGIRDLAWILLNTPEFLFIQ